MTTIRRALVLLAFAACASGDNIPPDSAPSVGALPPRLHMEQDKVIDPSGNQIVLRGYNWGQWGTEQPGDGKDNLDQGANSVRLPLRWWGDWKPGVDSRDPSNDLEAHIEHQHLLDLDHHIEMAASKGLWVILFVDSNYGQGAAGRTDNFWTNASKKQEFTAVWQFLVDRYKDKPFIGAFEILPEPQPVGQTDKQVKDWYDSIIPVIRLIDKRTPIVVGPNLGYNLYHLDAAHTDFENILYTGNLLFYAPEKIAKITAFTGTYHAPVWVDQIGIENDHDGALAEAEDLFVQLDAIHCGWHWWTYREDRTNDRGYGIFYTSPADVMKWLRKDAWYDLVSQYLP